MPLKNLTGAIKVPCRFTNNCILYNNMISSSTRRGFSPLFLALLFLITRVFPLFAQENNTESILNAVVERLGNRDYSAALALFNSLMPEEAEKTDILIMRASILNSAGRPAEFSIEARMIRISVFSASSGVRLLKSAKAAE